MPTPNNAYNRIATPVMEAETHGKTFILKNLDTEGVSGSLVCELLRYGWRYAENEMKWFLNQKQNCENSGGNGDIEYSAKAMQAINRLLDICMEYAQIDGNDAEREMTRQTIKNAIMDALTLDEDSGTFSFQLREKKHSSGLNKERISQLWCERNGRKENAIGDKEYKNYRRNLFSPEPRADARRLILQFAYLVEMDRKQTDDYLKKWILTDGIRWDSPWELAAAYEIEKNPAKKSDRASNLLDRIREHMTGTSDDSDYWKFIRSEEDKEYTKWERSFHRHGEQGLEEAFLCHWAWLLMIKRNSGETQECIPNFSEEEISRKLPAIYEALRRYAKGDVPAQSDEQLGLRREIIGIMKDRLLRLNAAVWEYARLDGAAPDRSRKLEGMGDYYPPQRKEVFKTLPGTFDKIGRRCKERVRMTEAEKAQRAERSEENKSEYRRSRAGENTEKGEDPDSILYRPNRSIILELGSVLGLTEAGFCQLLDIGGFYKLYARDFFEYALMSALNDMKEYNTPDTYRFGVSSQGAFRRDVDLENVKRQLKQGLEDWLEDGYSKLSCTGKKEGEMTVPNWVKFISEKLV